MTKDGYPEGLPLWPEDWTIIRGLRRQIPAHDYIVQSFRSIESYNLKMDALLTRLESTDPGLLRKADLASNLGIDCDEDESQIILPKLNTLLDHAQKNLTTIVHRILKLVDAKPESRNFSRYNLEQISLDVGAATDELRSDFSLLAEDSKPRSFDAMTRPLLNAGCIVFHRSMHVVDSLLACCNRKRAIELQEEKDDFDYFWFQRYEPSAPDTAKSHVGEESAKPIIFVKQFMNQSQSRYCGERLLRSADTSWDLKERIDKLKKKRF